MISKCVYNTFKCFSFQETGNRITQKSFSLKFLTPIFFACNNQTIQWQLRNTEVSNNKLHQRPFDHQKACGELGTLILASSSFHTPRLLLQGPSTQQQLLPALSL